MPGAVGFDQLDNADLTIETIYLGGNQGNAGDDPLGRLLPVGNQGGFRYRGSPSQNAVRIAVLYTSGMEIDWPDHLDPQTGIFTYYGDNRQPGRDLHDTPKSGNILLRNSFEAAHGTPSDRGSVPPFLLFEKAMPGRAVRFRGLLAPGAEDLGSDDDLNAIWRSKGGLRFQNYRAKFTVLKVDTIPRSWISSLVNGVPTAEAPGCPTAWQEWVHGRSYDVLTAPTTAIIRTRSDQLPTDRVGRAILQTIHSHFHARPNDFELCAVAIWRLIAPATGACDVTRPSRDGGRDAIGEYQLGPAADPVKIDFALEAKCYAETNSVGVREVSRLISRLRHRNFGVFVTLSYFTPQIYDEVRQDGHPIALISGRDVVDAMRANGYGDVAAAKLWLDTSFPAQDDA
ncbi:restriction endonuclease [Mycobacterium kubicae]|uniref:restriction endonuclease n=1 Tax=Mycobacterium kubicae TaxID=120959 RepID=UPI0007FC7282|nr:restriction endonuclease [Mycobacterium kubicae]OBK45597.1 restriction endonuclease [Mycobacterium kubicae]